MQYKILESYSSTDLADQVQASINEGWTPFGGVSASISNFNMWQGAYAQYAGTDSQFLFAQALIKEAPLP